MKGKIDDVHKQEKSLLNFPSLLDSLLSEQYNTLYILFELYFSYDERNFVGLGSECLGEKMGGVSLEGKSFLQVHKSVLNAKPTEDSLVSHLHKEIISYMSMRSMLRKLLSS